MISLIGFQDQLLNVIHAELYARQVIEEDVYDTLCRILFGSKYIF
jgi:hypothetical protein